AGDICVFTNHHHTIEELEIPPELLPAAAAE
ncbi:HslU--HslV peptidase proteolytic subunit, partial [Vibrio diabolicus]|nr:HslU--HslV peptidase proteolytic subunit [Vibrio diabolicus]